MSPVQSLAINPLVGLRFSEARQLFDGLDALHDFGFRHELRLAALAGGVIMPLDLALFLVFTDLLRASARGSAESGCEQKGRQGSVFHKTSVNGECADYRIQ